MRKKICSINLTCFSFLGQRWLQAEKYCMFVVNGFGANYKIIFPFAGHSRDDLVTSRLLEGWFIFGVAHLRIPSQSITIPVKNLKPFLACSQLKRTMTTATWQMSCCADWRRVFLVSTYLKMSGGLLPTRYHLESYTQICF